MVANPLVSSLVANQSSLSWPHSLLLDARELIQQQLFDDSLPISSPLFLLLCVVVLLVVAVTACELYVRWVMVNGKKEPVTLTSFIPYLGVAISYGLGGPSWLRSTRAREGPIFNMYLAGRIVTVILDPTFLPTFYSAPDSLFDFYGPLKRVRLPEVVGEAFGQKTMTQVMHTLTAKMMPRYGGFLPHMIPELLYHLPLALPLPTTSSSSSCCSSSSPVGYAVVEQVCDRLIIALSTLCLVAPVSRTTSYIEAMVELEQLSRQILKRPGLLSETRVRACQRIRAHLNQRFLKPELQRRKLLRACFSQASLSPAAASTNSIHTSNAATAAAATTTTPTVTASSSSTDPSVNLPSSSSSSLSSNRDEWKKNLEAVLDEYEHEQLIPNRLPSHVTAALSTSSSSSSSSSSCSERPDVDFLDLMLDSCDDEGLVLSSCIGITFAAMANTNATLCYMLLHMLHEPHLLQSVEREIRCVLPRHSGRLTRETLRDLVFIEAVQMEVTRMYAVLLKMRELQEDTTVTVQTHASMTGSVAPHSVAHTYHLPKGRTIAISSKLAMEDEQVFHSPLQFKPERFLDPNTLNQHEEDEKKSGEDRQSAYHGETMGSNWIEARKRFIGFGASRHICKGMQLAQLELKVLVVMLVNEYELLAAHHVDPLDKKNNNPVSAASDRLPEVEWTSLGVAFPKTRMFMSYRKRDKPLVSLSFD